ncbi:sigma-70 family RNA polymerase sigma factor [Algoriphagus sp. D3-2-R+10]|uniref:RNA polymerase sigma factor n=1 Tax=Algoriphagus aurantiacus TaxID=3103948 RepID=UPI002B39B33E|nr:sigma-70 family RNA polymerase sigma factor [Algoriphagus sp. D3-2-R+10]MEB2776103.1 sigma-70 family RNA polymerase sigma factor [Algoriphagus sp. D3-2-R+10]
MKSFFEAHIWPQRGRLYRLGYLWVRDRSLTEDMLQNVFEKSFEREDELRNHPNLAGWLVKSLKNEVLIHFRQTKRLDSLDGLEELKMEESASEDTKDSVRQVMNLVKGLPLRQQEIFHLREVEGLSYEEITEHLDISLEQVKVNLHRARKSIRERMLNQKSTK